MIETPEEVADRLILEIQRRGKKRPVYVALGNSLKFIAFTQKDYAYAIYGTDPTKLVGVYTQTAPRQDILDDLLALLKERGFI